MIADMRFGPLDARGVRRAQFVPRASIPVRAACLVANGLRETLRDLFGEWCELSIGEPASIDSDAWELLTREAHCFLTSGRQTDIVLVVPNAYARTLVLRAFGEGDSAGLSALSTLEIGAVERIADRCASSFDPLCADRRGASQRVHAAGIPVCVGYFDVRVHAPISIEIGVGIVRDLPDPGPAGTFPATVLAHVPIEVRAELGSGAITFATLARLEPGDVIPLETKVAGLATLKINDRPLATGAGGVSGGRYSFEVQTLARVMGAHS